MKNLLSLGKALDKSELRTINGGKDVCDLQCTWILDPIACVCIPSGT